MRVGSFAIVRNDQGAHLLSHRRDMDLWNLPGGGVERGEPPWEAVVREVREETGLEVEVKRLQGVNTKINSDDIVFSFECVVAGGKLELTEEADELRYFLLGDIPANFPPRQLERLKDAERRPDTPTLKTQTVPSSREHLSALRDRKELWANRSPTTSASEQVECWTTYGNPSTPQMTGC